MNLNHWFLILFVRNLHDLDSREFVELLIKHEYNEIELRERKLTKTKLI